MAAIFSRARGFARAKEGIFYLGRAAGPILLCLPSLWLLTQPFPWLTGLEAMALGTVTPLIMFGLIGGFRYFCRDEEAAWFEWAGIVFCFVCLQAYIFNTALHPDNRFNLLGGLLPNADPSMYLSLANQWERGGQVWTPQTTRQFFPCFLSAMLWLCHRDIKLIVSLFTLVTGSVAFLAWRQVRLVFGWLGATLFLALIFFFYRCECVGLLRTEQLGLWFALIALALMLQGLNEKREMLWNIGLFNLVMGLNTRAGAYFMLPLLVVYGGWIFRKGRWGWRSMLLGTGACFIAMLLNVICYYVFFAPPRPTSNFWLCFYGMLTGGNWVTAMNEVGLDFYRTNLIARDRALVLFKAEPWLVLKGFWKACVYVWTTNTFYGYPPTAEAFRSLMKWLTPIGAIVPWAWSVTRKRRGELEWFVFLVFVGALASLPFAPPWDGGHRVFAVSLPFLYLSPVLLVAWCCQQWRNIFALPAKSAPQFTYIDERLTGLSYASLVVLLLLTIVIPLGLMLTKRDRRIGWDPQYCVPLPGGCRARSLPEGYQIHLIPDTGRTFVPWVRVSDFRKSIDGNLEKLRAPWVLDLLQDLPEGTTIGTACHSNFFVIATDKARSNRLSQRNPILNPAWHRIVYDNEYPLPPFSRQLLARAKAPPLLPARGSPP